MRDTVLDLCIDEFLTLVFFNFVVGFLRHQILDAENTPDGVAACAKIASGSFRLPSMIFTARYLVVSALWLVGKGCCELVRGLKKNAKLLVKPKVLL